MQKEHRMQTPLLTASGGTVPESGLWRDAHGHLALLSAGAVAPLCPETKEPTTWTAETVASERSTAR